jgi:hypothetical protein
VLGDQGIHLTKAARDFSLLNIIRNGYDGHPNSYLMGAGTSFTVNTAKKQSYTFFLYMISNKRTTLYPDIYIRNLLTVIYI